MAVVKGKALWACVQEPNTKFEPVWSIDLIVDKDTEKQLVKEGAKVKKNEAGESVVKFKRKVTRRDGSRNKQPAVMDAARNPFTDLIGNGSVVNVQYRSYDWEVAGKSGVGFDLQGVQVLEHKLFAGADGSEFEAEDSEFA